MHKKRAYCDAFQDDEREKCGGKKLRKIPEDDGEAELDLSQRSSRLNGLKSRHTAILKQPISASLPQQIQRANSMVETTTSSPPDKVLREEGHNSSLLPSQETFSKAVLPGPRFESEQEGKNKYGAIPQHRRLAFGTHQ